MNHEDHDVLLGLNWFVSTGAGLFPAEKILKFPGLKIRLDTIGRIDQDKTFISDSDDENEYEVYVTEILDNEDIEEDSWEFNDTVIEIGAHEGMTKKDKLDYETKISKLIKGLVAEDAKSLGVCKLREHAIDTGDIPPIYLRPYRKSMSERETLKNEINIMLDAGIIEPSRSPWSSPVVLVPKKNGKKRFCVDYRKLNLVTKSIQWPLPRIQDIMDRLAGSSIFTTWDLTSGYWQMLVAENSREKTAFSTPDGHYQFIRMPFGLKNAPADFSRLMHQVLGDLSFVEIYLDDITIHSKTVEEHMRHLEVAASRLKEANLKLNAGKCTWMARQVKLLGFMVSGDGVCMDPDKIEAISKRVPPKDVKGVQTWLGICNYYRRHVKDFAKIAAPLVELLKKDVPFEWGNEQQISFEKLKIGLVSYPILKHPDFSKKFIISTDASGFALGAVLAQIDENKIEYAVAYASRAMKGAELHYGITEKECLAVVWAIKQFRVYLYGTHFTVITDHSALAWLMNITDPTGRLARWSIYLQAYDFTIVHRAGIKHSNADTLSRPVLVVTRSAAKARDNSPTEISRENYNQNVDPTEDELLIYRLKTGKNKSGIATKHAKRLDKLSLQYKLENGTLFYKKPNSDIFLTLPKRDEREQIIIRAHLLGHFQAEATFKRLNEKYFWKNMFNDIEKVVEKCDECREFHKTPPVENKAIAIPVRGMFERIGMDLVFGLPETEDGFVGMLVITEYLSKFVWVTPIKSKTAIEIAKTFWKYVGLFGPPKILLTDQGTEFNNEIMSKLVKLAGIEHRITSAYHPRTNGQTERFNRTMVEMLSKYTRNTLEINYAKALENISKQQEKQVRIQNDNHKTTEEKLEKGTYVYVRTTGLHDKLYPRYRGPFRIIDVTKHGNYIIENILKERMADTYPRQRLKVVSHNDENLDNIWRIQKIIKH